MSVDVIFLTIFGSIIAILFWGSWLVVWYDNFRGCEGKLLLRVYCLYFQKFKPLGKVLLFYPVLLLIYIVVVSVLPYYGCVYFIKLLKIVVREVQSWRRFLWDDAIQCGTFKCEVKEDL